MHKIGSINPFEAAPKSACQQDELVWSCLPPGKLTWQWKLIFFEGKPWKTSNKWWIFHCQLCLPRGTVHANCRLHLFELTRAGGQYLGDGVLKQKTDKWGRWPEGSILLLRSKSGGEYADIESGKQGCAKQPHWGDKSTKIILTQINSNGLAMQPPRLSCGNADTQSHGD